MCRSSSASLMEPIVTCSLDAGETAAIVAQDQLYAQVWPKPASSEEVVSLGAACCTSDQAPTSDILDQAERQSWVKRHRLEVRSKSGFVLHNLLLVKS